MFNFLNMFSKNKSIDLNGVNFSIIQDGSNVIVMYPLGKAVFINQTTDTIAASIEKSINNCIDLFANNANKNNYQPNSQLLSLLSAYITIYFTHTNNDWNFRYKNKKSIIVSLSDIDTLTGFNLIVRFLKSNSPNEWSYFTKCILDMNQEEFDKRMGLTTNFNNK